MLGFKKRVEHEEEEFEKNRLKDKRVYYDLNVRGKDPEEIRATTMDLFNSKGYKPVLNKLTKFEHMDEMDETFMGGQIKPVRGVIKASKIIRRGYRFLGTSKMLFVIAVTIFAYWFLFGRISLASYLSQLILTSSGVIFILAVLVLLFKDKIEMISWVKMVGVYDLKSEQVDMKVILTGDVSKEGEGALTTLEEDLGEIYGALASKYVRKRVRSLLSKKIDVNEVKQRLDGLRKQVDDLNQRFMNHDVSEEVYDRIRKDLDRQIEKLETIQEVV